MCVTGCFYSYFKDPTGYAKTAEELADGGTLGDLFNALVIRFPRLGAMRINGLKLVGAEGFEPPTYSV